MRRRANRMESAEARELLARALAFHIAGTDREGRPLIRTVNAVSSGDHLWFHGAPDGEKMEALGQGVVVAATETVAQIPSHFSDPRRACPATTFYRSVQARGILREETNPETKAGVLQALMEKYQPEGGFLPLSDPSYRKAVDTVLIAGVRLDEFEGKANLGQTYPAKRLNAILEGLWRRGLPSDPSAVETILDANPSQPRPAFLAGPDGVRLRCVMEPELVDAAVGLVADEYWSLGTPREVLRGAFRESSAWVGATDEQGTLLGTARGLSDGTKMAWVFDVAVAESHRGRGLGKALMRLLLDHPRMRHARKVWLATKDAQGLYEQFGFRTHEGFVSSHPGMVLIRA